MSAWQPIETAPKDGTVIDLWADNERWTDCAWGLPHHCCGEEGPHCDSDWHWLSDGWVHTATNWSMNTEPTHWMPLPAAPEPTP